MTDDIQPTTAHGVSEKTILELVQHLSLEEDSGYCSAIDKMIPLVEKVLESKRGVTQDRSKASPQLRRVETSSSIPIKLADPPVPKPRRRINTLPTQVMQNLRSPAPKPDHKAYPSPQSSYGSKLEQRKCGTSSQNVYSNKFKDDDQSSSHSEQPKNRFEYTFQCTKKHSGHSPPQEVIEEMMVSSKVEYENTTTAIWSDEFNEDVLMIPSPLEQHCSSTCTSVSQTSDSEDDYVPMDSVDADSNTKLLGEADSRPHLDFKNVYVDLQNTLLPSSSSSHQNNETKHHKSSNLSLGKSSEWKYGQNAPFLTSATGEILLHSKSAAPEEEGSLHLYATIPDI